MRATKAVIHLERLQHNIASVRRKIGQKVEICVPVKADAYGHGAVAIAKAAIKAGADRVAVAFVQEGVELRAAGVGSPILLLSLPSLEELPELVRHRLTPLVADAEFAEKLEEEAQSQRRTLPIHLKIDTGMGRIGCRPEEAADLARKVETMKALKIEGTATHLSVSDSIDPEDIVYTKKQLTAFGAAVESIKKAGIDPGVVHAANSGGVALHPESHLDMVRPGILSYGYPPVEARADEVPVRPVMDLETNIVFIKAVKKGESISYGRIWTADRDTVIATLPVGYADGLPRLLSGRLKALIDGKLFPIVGRVCMDQCMVDLGEDDSVRRWDRATIFGGDPRGPSAADLARDLGTIPYEITCGISKRVPRVYVEQE